MHGLEVRQSCLSTFSGRRRGLPKCSTARLIHNLKRRRIPAIIVKFVEQLLADRKTKLKFDDYISDTIDITNAIGQGDPLSMLLYIIYNADLLELPDNTTRYPGAGLHYPTPQTRRSAQTTNNWLAYTTSQTAHPIHKETRNMNSPKLQSA